MTVEEAVCQRILSLAPVTALTGQRWWILALPQHPTYPCGRVFLVDDPRLYHLRGPDGTSRARVQVDVFVSEAAAAAQGVNPYTLLTSVFDAMDGDGLGANATGLSGWIGTVGGSPPDVIVRGVFRQDRSHDYDPDELRVLKMTADYYVWWKAP